MTIEFSFPTNKETKVGDTVIITDPKWLNSGIEGLVVEVSKRGIYVQYDDIDEPTFRPCSYKIVKSEQR